MITILTPLSIKDVFTYGFRSRIYHNNLVSVHLITGSLTRWILRFIFSIDWVIYHDENIILDRLGGRKMIEEYVISNNPIIQKKLNWYIQQILKYSVVLKLKKNCIIIDGDTFPVDIIELLGLTNVRFLNKYVEMHLPYEKTISNLFGENLTSNNHNYVCEVFPINYERLLNLLSSIEANTQLSWSFSILSCSSELIGFSEYQTYGRFEEQYKGVIYKDFPTLRTYGMIRTPIQSIEVSDSVKFVTFESYHTGKGFYKILYFPFRFISKILFKFK
jgi:hypothetical protein